MKLFITILVVAVTLSSVAWAAPSRRKLNRKFTRQTEEQQIPVVPVATLQAAQTGDVTWKPDTTTTTAPPKVAVIEPETISLSPVGDVIENSQPTESTSLKTVVKGEDQSTPSSVDKEGPAGGNAPPPPQVQLPTVNLAGGLPPAPRPGSEGRPPLPPNGPGASPPPPPPPTTTKKPGDEDDSSSEEDGDEGDDDDTSADEEDEDEEDEEEEEDEEARKLRKQARKDSTTISKRVGRQEDSAEGHQPDLSRDLDAFIPGYISEEGEIFVPIDTVDQGVPYTIIPDRVTGQGRVGILLDDADSDDGDDATTSEEEDDEAQPVRISSFQIIYDKKKKNKEESAKEEDADDDDDEDDTVEDDTEEETGEGGESVEEKENVIKTEENRPQPVPSIIPEKVPSLAVVPSGNTAPGSPTIDKPLKLNPLRPPPLAYVQATKPTNEDDENELRYFRHLLPVGPPPPQHYYPEYYNPYFFNEPPTLRNGYYFDRVNVLRRRQFQ